MWCQHGMSSHSRNKVCVTYIDGCRTTVCLWSHAACVRDGSTYRATIQLIATPACHGGIGKCNNFTALAVSLRLCSELPTVVDRAPRSQIPSDHTPVQESRTQPNQRSSTRTLNPRPICATLSNRCRMPTGCRTGTTILKIRWVWRRDLCTVVHSVPREVSPSHTTSHNSTRSRVLPGPTVTLQRVIMGGLCHNTVNHIRTDHTIADSKPIRYVSPTRPLMF